MSFLREIQDAAIDSNTNLASLLRKCKVLAARLDSTDFSLWVDSELSGYKSVDNLPDYRVFRVNSKGHFFGAFGSGLENANIPLLCIPKKYREDISCCNMTQPVASIEALVRKSGDSIAQESWNPDIVAMLGQNIYEGMTCMQAWKVIPITLLIGALDKIRNRILNFVIEIEKQDPAAGEAELNSASVPSEKVTQIFNTHISGNVQNVATGSHGVKQNATSTNTNAELFDKLLEVLQALQNPEITDSISKNIKEMRSTQGTDSFKSHYQKFMSLLADHVQVLGPVLGPFLPALAEINL